METIEVTRVEFNSQDAQDEFQNQMRFVHIPVSHMSYQEVFAVASRIQDRFKASFRMIACEAIYEGAFFKYYQNTTTTFFKY
ncbi:MULTISPECIES: hypothetical protein [Acinetobacter]|uniref:Uncharacterized protein n=1 Tax=Acinetobacter piscicola TaxID=2006115 RepID=A0A7S6VXW7_9GAMM|nr:MULTISPECIES: hypothetical protein [Acinetobacter]QOW46915.1 hypothetical protein G0028_14015 [Acinetobacter piscicola]